MIDGTVFETDATRLPRIMQCYASTQMPSIVPDFDDDPTARDEGNAAHWMAQQVFNGKDLDTLIDRKAYNGVLMDAEMARHVRSYLIALDCGSMEIITSFTGDGWRINSRADHIVYNPNHVIEYVNGGNGNVLEHCESVLTIDDFKYGFRLVEPEMNWTLIAHALGYCLNNNVRPDKIIFRIHQPRRFHPEGPLREWVIDYATLSELYWQIDATLRSGDMTLRTGPFCVNCHAAPNCPAWREASMNALDATSRFFTDNLSCGDISDELTLLEHANTIIAGRLKALKELATHKIANGDVIPDYVVEQKWGNRKFKVNAAYIKALTNVSPTIETLCTPAELIRRGVDEAIVNMISERPNAGRSLVRVDANKRAQRILGKRSK